jgi:hypothetical protein
MCKSIYQASSELRDWVRDSGTRLFLGCIGLENSYLVMMSLYMTLQPNAGPMSLAVGAAFASPLDIWEAVSHYSVLFPEVTSQALRK